MRFRSASYVHEIGGLSPPIFLFKLGQKFLPKVPYDTLRKTNTDRGGVVYHP